MKILHTADWHLGKKLEQSERTDEHQYFLDWLIERLNSECIDVLIVAGDIFDTGSPSNTAFQQYYRFLRRVKNTCCREVIIIGGNHDSISTLNAPKELLKYFNVHIVGGVPEEFGEQIIPIKNDSGKVELAVCAVPFLRDKDVRLSISGETSVERESRIKQGICDHYNNFKEHIQQYKLQGVPVIATGHLFAAGSSTSESEKEIHVGNLGQVCGDQFPVEFDYIALGHIHRPQVVSNLNHIRYSGSPVPLSFSESDHTKLVIILEFQEGKLVEIQELEVPCCRKLIRFKGDVSTVQNKLLLLE
jgi:exonuclease SbcD